MSVQEMPELLDVLGILQNVQVMHDDEPKWLLDALNAAIKKGVKKSVKYRKKTTLKLSLNFIPGQINQLKVEATLEAVEPKPDVMPLLAFTDTKGQLYGEDPQQQRLPLEFNSKRSAE